MRIGIGIAQGLAFGADLPMLGVSTLAAMAQGSYRQHQSEQVMAAIDARMNEVYWGQYCRQQDGDLALQGSELVIKPEMLITDSFQRVEGKWLTAGTGWESYAEGIEHNCLSRPFQAQCCILIQPIWCTWPNMHLHVVKGCCC